MSTRLWHKDLIRALPDKLLLNQFRECGIIASNIKKYNSPKSVYTNKIMCYNISEFSDYCKIVLEEIVNRRRKVSKRTIGTLKNTIGFDANLQNINRDIYAGWHDLAYLIQCYYMLEELRNCGEINNPDWYKILKQVQMIMANATLSRKA